MGMSETAPPLRVSPFALVLIIVTAILSVFMIYQGIETQAGRGEGSYLLTLGAVMLAFSVYMLLQLRKNVVRLPLGAQKVISTILCQRCGFKSVRDFQRGDYVFKEVEPCPKCSERMMIASIYREVKEAKG